MDAAKVLTEATIHSIIYYKHKTFYLERIKMKLDNYTASKIKEQISEFLFIKWLQSDRDDWQDEEIKELWSMYHKIMSRQIEVV